MPTVHLSSGNTIRRCWLSLVFVRQHIPAASRFSTVVRSICANSSISGLLALDILCDCVGVESVAGSVPSALPADGKDCATLWVNTGGFSDNDGRVLSVTSLNLDCGGGSFCWRNKDFIAVNLSVGKSVGNPRHPYCWRGLVGSVNSVCFSGFSCPFGENCWREPLSRNCWRCAS